MYKRLLLVLAILSHMGLSAQVTIGSGKEPKEFSTLEVNSSTGGVRYPQMDLGARPVIALNNSKAYGLIIFNTTDISLECFVEDYGWRNIAAENNTGNIGGLATIQTNGKESTSTTFTYNFLINFPTIVDISNLRVGKNLDKFNTVTKVEGATAGTLNKSTYPIKVILSKDKIESLAEMDPYVSCYAIYQEKGIDRRVEFTINTTDNSLRLVAKN